MISSAIFVGYLNIFGLKNIFAQNDNFPVKKEGQLEIKKFDKEDCKLTGKAQDRQDNAIPGLNITFKNSQLEKSVITDASGKYELDLPIGIFNISIETYFNYEPYKRAKLNIQCKNELSINIFPFHKRETHNSKSLEYQFNTFSKPWVYDKRLNLVITYLGKKREDNFVIYKDTMLTFDNLTISANKLIQNFKNKTITAEGNVWVEDGKKRTDYEKLTLKFSKNGIKIEGKEKLSSER